MKKKRFGLQAKIMLLTGLLTILTISTSLTVNLLVSYYNTKESYTNSCEIVTDNLESVFTTNKEGTLEIINIIIEKFDEVKDKYDTMSVEEKDTYQEDVRTELFGPPDGKGFGMSYERSLRKASFTESIARMQFLCSSYQVPLSSFTLYESTSKSSINIINSDTTIDANFDIIGTKAENVFKEELAFFDSGESFKTIIIKNTVYSFNLVEIDTGKTNYKCFVQGLYPLADFNKTFTNQLAAQLVITGVSGLFLVIIYAILTRLFLVKNVERLITSTNTFMDKMKNDESLEIVDANIKSRDEIRDLSDEFMVMQEQIINYVDNIKKAKDIEQAFKTEIDIASKIQLESLPARTHFDKNIELRAFIKPAKGVGGDFYDYFYIDNDHLALVIADVSGKGIPASLFMMRSKESIQSASMNEKDLGKVFFKVNNSLCINNKEGYFVTAFLGILDLKTYELNFVSAGHERPFIRHGSEYRRLEVESNFVLGLEEDFNYKSQKIKLKEGDSIFLYTDGLNEAINVNEEEFGYERIQTSLEKGKELKQNISTVIEDLEAFENGAEQFDDITILSLGIKKNTITYSYLNPTYNDIDDLVNKVEKYLKGMDENTVSKMGVIIDEAMNNIISYGKTKTNKKLEVTIEKTESGANLIFVDNSHPFNPLLKEKRTVQENMDQGIVGGLGISIIKSITEDAEYVYSNNKNILVVKF